MECVRILQNACDVLSARVKWAYNLGSHSPIDAAVLRAYSVLPEDAAEGGIMSALKSAAVAAGAHIRKRPILLPAIVTGAVGALTGLWFYGYVFPHAFVFFGEHAHYH